MARLVTFKDLDKLVTNVGKPLTTVSDCSRGQALIVSGENEVDLADTQVSRSLGRFLGLATTNALAGSKVEYQFLGPFQMDSSQGWSAGQPIYVDNNGDLTSTPTAQATGYFIQVIGVALSDDTVFIFREPAYPF